MEHSFLTMTGLYNVLERVREFDWANGPGRAVLKSAMRPSRATGTANTGQLDAGTRYVLPL